MYRTLPRHSKPDAPISCQHYKEKQKELISQLEDLYPRQLITLAEIYAEKSRQIVYNYLKKTRIATREWLLGIQNTENTENTENIN